LVKKAAIATWVVILLGATGLDFRLELEVSMEPPVTMCLEMLAALWS